LFSTGTESFPALPASSHPVAGNLSAFPDIAKHFFVTRRNAASSAKYQRPFGSCEIAVDRCHFVAGFGKDPINVPPVSVTDLNSNNSAMFETFHRSLGDHAIGLKAIGATIERPVRVVQPDFRL
jgi:hypothetical protein